MGKEQSKLSSFLTLVYCTGLKPFMRQELVVSPSEDKSFKQPDKFLTAKLQSDKHYFTGSD